MKVDTTHYLKILNKLYGINLTSLTSKIINFNIKLVPVPRFRVDEVNSSVSALPIGQSDSLNNKSQTTSFFEDYVYEDTCKYSYMTQFRQQGQGRGSDKKRRTILHYHKATNAADG